MDVNNGKSILNLVSSVNSYSSQAYQYSLQLSEQLRVCKENSPNKPPFAINFLEHSKAPETFTSWIIRHIFAYTYNGHHPFFESFANTFLREIGFKMEWINHPVINKDHEYKNIDILVRDRRYAVIIENKLKGAPFQPNQLARYIARMNDEDFSYEQIFVVVLPPNNDSYENLPDSVWNLPQDWELPASKRKCRIAQYSCWCDYEDFQPKRHCSYCSPLKELFHNRALFIHKEFSEWLYDCVMNNALGLPDEELRKQYVLTSAVLQFVDFLNSLYQTRENNKYKMDIQKFLSEQLNLETFSIDEQLSSIESKQSDLKELITQLGYLWEAKIKELVREICSKYREYIIIDGNNGYRCYFHSELDFNGVGVDVILAQTEDSVDFCQIETKRRRKLPEIIRNDYDISEELNDKNNSRDCIWRYDSYKESLLRFDKVFSKLLELQNKG